MSRESLIFKEKEALELGEISLAIIGEPGWFWMPIVYLRHWGIEPLLALDSLYGFGFYSVRIRRPPPWDPH